MKNVEVRFLTEAEYMDWDEFVDSSPQGSIFNKSYWLRAVCDDFKILVCERDGNIMGGIALPSLYGKYYRNPKLTPRLGVLLQDFPDRVKYPTRLSTEMDIINELIEKLPEFKMFDYNFSYNFTNLLPFLWKDFTAKPTYTYVIEDLSDLDAVYGGFQNHIRQSIKKAEKSGIRVTSDLGIEDFYNVNSLSFKRQNIDIPYSLEFLTNLDKTIKEHNAGKMFFALTENNSVAAVVYVVYDDRCAYYLLSGADPEYRDTGAQTYLLWESIRYSSGVTKAFDFEGSMIKGIEGYFREFGGRQKIMYTLHKSSPMFDFVYGIARKNKDIIRKIIKV